MNNGQNYSMKYNFILFPSYMESEEEEANVSKRRSSGRHVHYADSSITSSNTESSEMDKYLNAAFDDDEDDEDNTASGKHGKVNINIIRRQLNAANYFIHFIRFVRCKRVAFRRIASATRESH